MFDETSITSRGARGFEISKTDTPMLNRAKAKNPPSCDLDIAEMMPGLWNTA